jgi:hypothetical protein
MNLFRLVQKKPGTMKMPPESGLLHGLTHESL